MHAFHFEIQGVQNDRRLYGVTVGGATVPPR